MSSPKNLEQKKTSFLTKSNSAFIENMYIKYIENDPDLPLSWKDYFDTLNDDVNSVVKELEGPSWQPKKKTIKIKKSNFSDEETSNEHIELAKRETIKSILIIDIDLIIVESN